MTEQNKTERKIPNHVAIIMDGNARWAQSKGMPIKKGHIKAIETLGHTIENCIELGIKHLTVFAFSTENWKRSKREVTDLMTLAKYHVKKQAKELNKKGVRVKVLGSFEKIEKSLIKQIQHAEKLTENNDKLHLNICFNYGGRREMVDATKKIAKKVLDGVISIDEVDEKLVKENLYNPTMPDPDLFIRTSGEQRFSGFLLWQISYAELFFTKTYWPDFDKEELIKAIDSFNKRERRYGKRNY